MNIKILGLVLMAFPLSTFAGDIEAGKAKSATCAACHGANGISNVPVYPNLQGQHEGYLVSALNAYKAGQRQGGLSAVMVPQATSLSDQDIEDLAAYYSSLK
ncbi:c-type cytochrome [Psychromonas sp. GE-S-Ul-11]|jgi:cytochrome c553|uniref:c-type cytochrome n=1 Tax=unclassified Psychromonas TaxID=2614957 RepID=UPI00390C6A8A